jgi:type II secretory pathway component PulF
VTALLLIVIIPQFEDMFQKFRGRSAGVYPMVIDLSDFVQARILILIALVGGIYGHRSAQEDANKKFAHFLDRVSLKCRLSAACWKNRPWRASPAPWRRLLPPVYRWSMR